MPPPPTGPPWGPPPANSPRTARATKWVLGGLALLVVVVVTVAVTFLVTRSDPEHGRHSAGPPPGPIPDAAEVASAGDDGPIEIITKDPTCADWAPVINAFAAIASQGWDSRDPTTPAAQWNSEQRKQYADIATAMRKAADETSALSVETPHRVMRELYEQSVAYWHAYVEALPAYQPSNDHLARVATGTSNAVTWICSAIEYGSAAARAPLTVPSPAPLHLESPGDPEDPMRFITESDAPPICPEWISTVDRFDVQTAEWLSTDPNLPVEQWSPQQRSIWTQVSNVMSSNANQIQDIGMRSENAIFDDFAALAAQYRRAFVQSFPSYVPADGHLANVAAYLVATNDQACKAAGVR
ncbi:hypothetical protein BST38_16485 [Mycolicibacterium parafortuitum]|nr:hypothetical protein BST38_16485 [Mycolicibacterium parafortuitum]